MTKKDILGKIKRTILGEDAGTPGITITNKVKKSDKKFNDDYYKETDKKFKDYLGIKKDDFDAPKVNADEKQEKSYGGSGMEGLTYDNEGTEVDKKFIKRVDDLNKPSKDYYLKKDEVDDVYSKLKNKSSDYKKDKKIFQNTPPVRAIQAKTKNESTIKRLTYKTEFINESVAINLIPEEFKKNDLVFEMTDGNKLMKVRWEGGKNGRAVILLSKDTKKINEELERMHRLYEYNSRDAFSKTNLLTEDEELHNMVSKLKNKGEDEGTTTPTDSTAVKRPDPTNPITYSDQSGWEFNPYTKKLSPEEFESHVVNQIREISGYSSDSTKTVSGKPITTLRNNLDNYVKQQLITPQQAERVKELNLQRVTSVK